MKTLLDVNKLSNFSISTLDDIDALKDIVIQDNIVEIEQEAARKFLTILCVIIQQ